MKNLETSKEKIQNICDIIKEEAIEPAHQQAHEIVENAKIQAAQIVKEAEEKAKEMVETRQKELKALESQVTASLRLAAREALATLKEKIEKKLFSPTLHELLKQELSQDNLIADLINSLIQAVEKEGMDGDLLAYIGKDASKEKVSEYLTKSAITRLKKEKIFIGGFQGGAQLSIPDNKITLDMSDEAIYDLFTKFLQKDFQKLLFGEEKLG